MHETFPTTVAEIYNVDNVGPHGSLLSGWEMFRRAGEDLDALIQQARAARKRILPLGAGWALSKINITNGWLVNTKLLNGCFDVSDKYFDPAYPAEGRPNLVLVQAGMQIAELNTYLELLPRVEGQRRALHAAGIGNGQTVAGAISGNTHGSHLTYGAMPDFVTGLHIATGSGQTIWLERKSKPVMNQDFVDKLGARLIRDDDIFNAAVVSFGTFRDHRRPRGGDRPDLSARVPAHRQHQPRQAEGEAQRLRGRHHSARPLPLRVHLRPLLPTQGGHGGKRAKGALYIRRSDAQTALDHPRQARLRARHHHLAGARPVPQPIAGAFADRNRVQAVPQECPVEQSARQSGPALHLVDLLPRGLHRERVRGVGQRRGGDDRHRLAGVPGDGHALDLPGPAVPGLDGDARLHPARADHGSLRARDDPRRALR
ncbi:MAG: FAD-binding protein [Anaerolineae bacterium]|nr:FAD-binding protein [Anaerolineae bacterium]